MPWKSKNALTKRRKWVPKKRRSFYRMVTANKKGPDTEYKFLDSVFTAQAIGTTAVVYGLSVIAQGNDYFNRNGNIVEAKSLYGRMNVNSSSVATFNTLRAMVIVDNDNQGTAPVGTDIFEGAAYTYLSPLNHNNSKRFTVLWDKVYVVEKANKAACNVKLFRKLNHSIRYGGTAGFNPREGNLYLVLLSDSPVNTPYVDFDFRLRFTDA